MNQLMKDTTIPPQDAPKIVDSPCQGVIEILDILFSHCPQPRVNTEGARYSGELLGRYLINLLTICGELNVTGYHSVAVTLFRPLEDALDLLAAVTMIAGAAERWESNKLKPSAAASLWVDRIIISPVTGESLAEYRKRLRSTFNPFSHCAPLVPQWDIFTENHPTRTDLFRLRVNHKRHVIVSNAYRIDAFFIAHLWEVLLVVENAYKTYFEANPPILQQISTLKVKMQQILAEHYKHGFLDSVLPPELESREVEAKHQPTSTQLAELWQGSWSCGASPITQGRLTLKQHGCYFDGILKSKSNSLTITEQLSGVQEGNRLLLDGIHCQISPPTHDVSYSLDSFEFTLSPDGAQLVGIHSCENGTGDALFICTIGAMPEE